MKLVIYSNESIDHLQKMVEEKFSPIKNKNIPAPKYNEMPYDEENLG
jgi:secreted Zn-dependent insulinase-like peptidase